MIITFAGKTRLGAQALADESDEVELRAGS